MSKKITQITKDTQITCDAKSSKTEVKEAYPMSYLSLMRGTSGFAVLRYRVSFLRGIAVLRAKIGGIAVLSFYSAVCGIVINQHPKFMKYHFPVHFPDKEPNSLCLSPPVHPGNRHPAEERNLSFI